MGLTQPKIYAQINSTTLRKCRKDLYLKDYTSNQAPSKALASQAWNLPKMAFPKLLHADPESQRHEDDKSRLGFV